MSITIPNFPLPFDIPSMMHPLFVHFAIALPVILLTLELINLIAKRRILTGINIFFTILMPLIYFATYLTGIEDAKNLNIEALEAHKQLGVYMVYGSLIVLLFKLISSAINKIQIKIFFYLALVAFIATSFIEGKRGGELVYKYGANVKALNNENATTVQKPNKIAVEKLESKEQNNTKAQDNNTTNIQEQKEHNSTLDTTKEQNNIKAQDNNTTNTQEQKEHNNTLDATKEQNNTKAQDNNTTNIQEQKEHNNTLDKDEIGSHSEVEANHTN